jgi:hypothetical protein
MSSSSTASKLESLIGLRNAKRVVWGLAKSELQTHAVLFYGSEGSGKEEVADILCESWLCTGSRGQGADGTCPPCHAWAKGRNPDVLKIAPHGASNIITIDQLQPRQPASSEDSLPMEVFIRTQPLMSKYKVVIISDANRMNATTSNALLKRLEEPPPFVKLILTSASTGGIEPTILSRVLAVPCALPSDEEIRQKFPQATADDILISEGAPEKVGMILANPEPYHEALRFARTLRAKRKGDALVVAEGFRSVAEQLDAKLKCGVRQSQAELLRILSLLSARDPNFPAKWGEDFVNAHERILANGHGSIVTDALFAKILGTY